MVASRKVESTGIRGIWRVLHQDEKEFIELVGLPHIGLRYHLLYTDGPMSALCMGTTSPL